MQKQQRGNGKRGIEWTNFTSNPLPGCFHDCGWIAPDGTLVICYAENIANRVAQKAYPHGFAYHYALKRKELRAWKKLLPPSKIFVGSMSDIFGDWVTEEEIHTVLDGCKEASW